MLAFSWFSYQCSGQVTEQLLKAFPGESGHQPYWLIAGLDGGLYGTLHNGGRTNGGAVFRINKDATEYKLLHTFGRFAGDGQIPGAGITQGADGSLYGATSAGGTSGFGTIFRLATNGIDYQVLYSFNTNDGHSPSPVIQGSDGALYGTCNSGGLYGYGTIFRITTNGGNFVVLHNFDPGAGDGEYPQAALVQGRDSALYGTTWWDGISGKGNIFKINPDGAGYAVIHNFGSVTNDGANCTAPLIQAADGALYGSCEQGGNRSVGTVFKVNLDGTGYGILHHFGSTGDGQNPYAPLLQATNGMLYGTTTFGGSKRVGTIFQITTNGTVYTIQHSFTGS